MKIIYEEKKWERFTRKDEQVVINPCCNVMRRCLERQWHSDTHTIDYNPNTKVLKISKMWAIDAHPKTEEINYCPFCGKKVVIE